MIEMRFEDGFGEEWQGVLTERVTTEETRQLLSRLAMTESGGAGSSTVGDICEAAGTTPQVVGRMLADIRGVTWQELFGQRLDSVENRLDTVGEQLTRYDAKFETISRGGRPSTLDNELEEEVRRMVEYRAQKQAMAPIVAVIGFIFVMIFAGTLFSQPKKHGVIPNSYETNIPTIVVSDAPGFVKRVLFPNGAYLYKDSSNNIQFYEPGKGIRLPTEEESKSAYLLDADSKVAATKAKDFVDSFKGQVKAERPR